MRKVTLLASVLLVLSVAAVPGAEARRRADASSDNLTLLANFNQPFHTQEGEEGDPTAFRGPGTDLAFWGNLMVAGVYSQPGGFRLLDISKPSQPRLVGEFACPGSQADVSIWKDLVFVSVDAALAGPDCPSASATPAEYVPGTHWEGIRIVSIKDPTKPQQIATVATDCGSHTHTIVPDLKKNRLLLYIQSYPLSGQGVRCNAVSHRKISVVEVPLNDPTKAQVVSTPSVSPAVGCHDVTVFPARKLAIAACISESQVWDVSDLENPEVISHIPNPPGMQISHSSAWSWDGKTVVIGDEMGGAEADPGCANGGGQRLGALYFFDVTDETNPEMTSYFQIPRSELSLWCTAHNFNVVPLPSGKNVLVASAYQGGTSVIDFTDPSAPTEIGWFIADDDAGHSDAWSSYWYNGYIYVNNFDEDVQQTTEKTRGIDVLSLKDLIVKGAARLPYLNPSYQSGFSLKK